MHSIHSVHSSAKSQTSISILFSKKPEPQHTKLPTLLYPLEMNSDNRGHLPQVKYESSEHMDDASSNQSWTPSSNVATPTSTAGESGNDPLQKSLCDLHWLVNLQNNPGRSSDSNQASSSKHAVAASPACSVRSSSSSMDAGETLKPNPYEKMAKVDAVAGGGST